MYTITLTDFDYSRDVDERVVRVIPFLDNIIDSSHDQTVREQSSHADKRSVSVPLYFGDMILINKYPHSIIRTVDVCEVMNIVIDWCEYHVEDMMDVEYNNMIESYDMSVLSDYDQQLFEYLLHKDIDYTNYISYVADYMGVTKLLSFCFGVVSQKLFVEMFDADGESKIIMNDNFLASNS